MAWRQGSLWTVRLCYVNPLQLLSSLSICLLFYPPDSWTALFHQGILLDQTSALETRGFRGQSLPSTCFIYYKCTHTSTVSALLDCFI